LEERLKMDKSLVTIGLTCFNAEDTINRAIRSALSQDWTNIEVIIVDDFSFDDSVLAVEQAIAGNPLARLVRHSQNKGPAAARNTLLQEARGEFVAFFDDDDESLPGRITGQVNILLDYEGQSGATLVACYAEGVRHYPNGYVMELPAIGSCGGRVPNGPGLADYLLFYRKRPDWFYGSGVPTCALLARVSTFCAVGGFDEELRRVEDVDFSIRLALSGGHFVGTSESLFVQYDTDAVDKSPEKNLEAEQRLVEKNKDYLRSINRYYYALHWPLLRYRHFKHQYWHFTIELLGLLLRYPLAVTKHLWATGPQRLLHERKMAQSKSEII